MFKTILLSTTLLTAAAFSAEPPLEYTVTCEASRHLTSGVIPPTPEVTVTARVKLTPFTGPGHLCNEAVTAHADQKRFRAEAEVIVGVELADKSKVMVLQTEPKSKFGECELSPGAKRNGVLSLSSRRALCTDETPCGNFGVIDPSRPAREIEGVSFFINLQHDEQGNRKLAPSTSYVMLEKMPAGGGHPVHEPFKLNDCRFE